MLSLGALSFAAPWLLLAGALLPILWWLLRLTPPSPKRLIFPAIRLLFGLRAKEETPHKTPWWLILLRLAVAALTILGLAQPLWNADRGLEQPGPLVLALDDGWASANLWSARMEAASKLIDKAARAERPVLLLTTAIEESGDPVLPVPAGIAASRLAALLPRPWPSDRAQAARNLGPAPEGGVANVYWISDGLASVVPDADREFLSRLAEWGPVAMIDPGKAEGAPGALLALAPERGPDGMWARVARARAGAPQRIEIRGLDSDGHTLGNASANFAAEESIARVKLELPLQLANRIQRVVIEGWPSAGGVALIDDGAGSKPIGLASDNAAFSRQPMLGELYYIERALAPTHVVHMDRPGNLLRQDLAMIVLPDQTAISQSERDLLGQWVAKGGMLVRFAGERLASGTGDELLPVRLRQGDRVLGGALSWSAPASLAPFPENSPFAGLILPKDVRIERQVLAEPEIDLGTKTWARLADGTPLVTGKQSGEGYLVLFHVGGNAEWSDLPLSGLFVEMLERLIRTARGLGPAPQPDQILRPAELLDGFGNLGPPPSDARAIASHDLAAGRIGPSHPPGLYGPDGQRRALNLASAQRRLAPLEIAAASIAADRTIDLAPPMLGLAFLLLLIDFALALVLRGYLRIARAGTGTAAIAAIAFFCSFDPADAQALKDEEIFYATETTRLAYVRTGVPELDANSRAGLFGLTEILLRRTSTDVGEPVAIDLEADELAFYPLLYWPVSATQRNPSPEAIDKLNRYIAAGGLIFFDTADQNLVGMGDSESGPGAMRLRQLATGLDIPPLIPVPADHVLTRAFYLLRDFPGRWIGGTLWVETSASRVNDGVSAIVVGANDYAAAWAIDDLGQPLYPTTPGGERQREMAYRFGVNLVMYALTGNYKADQVHVPAILERLGQ